MRDDLATQRKAVHYYIEGSRTGKVKIRTFHRLGQYLGTDISLREKAGLSEPHLWDIQAQSYFNRLVIAISEASNPSSDIVIEAVKQLYDFFFVLDGDIEGISHFMPQRVEERLDWIQTIRTMPDMVHDLSAKIDKHDDDITAILIEIKKWMVKYGKVLDKIDKELKESKKKVREIAGRQ